MKDKVVVFSDGLDLEMVQKIEEEGRRLEGEDGEMGGGGVKRSYGVGTWLTNDFEKKVGEGKSKALNIVSFSEGKREGRREEKVTRLVLSSVS